MVSYAARTERSAVDAALAEFDRLGRDAFLHKYGFGPATEYFLISDGGFYDSKAIFGVAYGNQHGTALASEEFNGGKNGAAGRLSQLGYSIGGLESRGGRLSYDTFEAALNEFRLPVENIPMAREFVMRHDFVEFYIPRSRSYIAMIPRGGSRPTGWIHVGSITERPGNGHVTHFALPYNKIRDGGGSRSRQREESEQSRCDTPGCGMQLPASGICDYC
jgi:hypothetical protein